MTNIKIERINSDMQKIISQVISEELKDPRLKNVLTTVLKVETTNDLSFSTIYVSFLPSENSKELYKILKSSLNFIRGRVSHSMNLRKTPELILQLDVGTAHAIKINQIIDELHKKEGK